MKLLVKLLFTLTLLLILGEISLGQGLTSSIGDRVDLELYGGPAVDVSFDKTTPRLFAALSSPATLLKSDDNGMNWIPAFPFDSLEYNFGNRGWGGGAQRVLTNHLGWVGVQTGGLTALSATVISDNFGDSFQTAADAVMLEAVAGVQRGVTAMDLTDSFIYSGMEEFIVRNGDPSVPGTMELIARVDTFPGATPGSVVKAVAAANNMSGFPLYVVVDIGGITKLYRVDGSDVIILDFFPLYYEMKTVFTHQGMPTGELVFLSGLDVTTGTAFIERSFDFGNLWDPVSPQFYNEHPLSDVDFHDAWIPLLPPQSMGVRLSIPGGIISDNLGDTWEGPSPELGNYGVATFPFNIDQIYGSDHVGVKETFGGIYGVFNYTQNFGLANLTINDMDKFSVIGGPTIMYVATDAGLAYSGDFDNPGISPYDKWQPPNGQFPIDLPMDEKGISAVAVDPTNPDHVIAGGAEGFYVSFAGYLDFTQSIAIDWNAGPNADPYVTDIKFIDPMTLVAVTGVKNKSISGNYFLPAGNIWMSYDGGFEWVKANSGPDLFEMGNCIEVGNVMGQTMIYIGTGYKGTQFPNVPGALWHSPDEGLNWIRLNSGPSFQGEIDMPIYDIDMWPFDPSQLYLSCENVLARTDNGGSSYFIADLPYNRGKITSCLMNPVMPDSMAVSIGREIYKYNLFMDDADLKFRGYPGELFNTTGLGSTLGGSNAGLGEIVDATTFLLDLRVFVEGPYEDFAMRTDLYNAEVLPLEQPFNQAPWFYDGTERVNFIPTTEVVDWVLIELRKTTGDSTTATADKRFERIAAFLLSDGTIVDDDGITAPRFSYDFPETKDEEKAYADIYAPGHVNVRTSSEMQSAKSATFFYDFTSGPDQAYGGANAHKQLEPGLWGMIAGDANQDGQVENADKVIWYEQNGSFGYFMADFNRDGHINLLDLQLWSVNAGRGSEAAE